MPITYRPATTDDIPALEALIPLSVRALQAPYYTAVQMEAALGTVFGVDSQLIRDGTYFLAEEDGRIVACGGWSKRKTSYGGDAAKTSEDTLRDPETEPAMIRAFFVHPDYTRQGIGRHFIKLCEAAIIQAGFKSIEIVATLAGEPLYTACGYKSIDRLNIPLPSGEFLAVVRMSSSFR
jgi:N-acetylglutamate synthase-like GNAT family acetyltransferase